MLCFSKFRLFFYCLLILSSFAVINIASVCFAVINIASVCFAVINIASVCFYLTASTCFTL